MAETLATSALETPPPVNGKPKARMGRPAIRPESIRRQELLDRAEQYGEISTEDAAELEDLTRQPAKGDWSLQFRSYSDDEWANELTAYLYRTDPLTDRKANGKAVNLRKYSVCFDQEDVMKEFGSGGYRIDLCRTEPASRKSRRIAQHYFSIMNMDYPPRVPFGDWLDEPQNKIWEWAKPGIQTATQQMSQNGMAPQFDAGKMMDTVLNAAERLAPKSDGMGVEIAKGLSAMQSTLAEMANPTRLIGLMKELRPPDRPDPMVGFMDKMIDAQRVEIAEMRKEMRESRNHQPKGLIEQVLEALPTFGMTPKELIGMIAGGRRASATADVHSGWIGVAEKFVEHVPEILDAVNRKQSAETPNGGFQLPAAQQPAQQAQPQQPPPPANEQGPEATMSQDQKEEYKQILQTYGPLIQQAAPFMVDYFTDSKMTGYDFRDWFISRQGLNNWTSLRSQVGAEKLVNLSQMHPLLKNTLIPVEDFRAFLN
jgi:hypothetical protein